jgi:cysteine desulfuration protein SufE
MSLPTFATIADNLAFLDDWEDRYRYLIELGRLLPPYPEDARDEAHKVRGCASQVWLDTRVEGEGAEAVLHFAGDSDAHIVKGLVALALALHSGRTAREIAGLDAFAALKDLRLAEHLSSQRSNGFRSLVDTMRREAAMRLAAA